MKEIRVFGVIVGIGRQRVGVVFQKEGWKEKKVWREYWMWFWKDDVINVDCQLLW